MQIEVKELEFCNLSVNYSADIEEINNKRKDVIKLFKDAPVPGFRKGKASQDAIRIHYRQQIDDSLKRALVEDAYHNTVFEKNLRPHGAPRFKNHLLTKDKFTCEFDVHTKPEIELSEYKGLQIPKPHEPISAADMTEKMLQELRLKFGDVTPYAETDFIQDGDNVIVDYEGAVDGVTLDNLTAQGEMLTVGRSQLASFDDNLLGMTPGETRTFFIKVPENGLPSLVGKSVEFKVTLTTGSKSIPCALDDTLATKMGKTNMEELRKLVHDNAQARVTHNLKSAVIDKITALLVESTHFQVPNWMSLSEAQYLAYNAKLDWNTLADSDKEKYMEVATRNCKLSLILEKLREVEPEAQLSDHELFEIIKQNIRKSNVEKTEREVIEEMNKTGYLQILMARLKDEYALDFIVKSSQIVE